MLIKILFFVFLATISTALATEDDDLVNTVLSSGTNIINEIVNVNSNEQGKYSVDLKALYKKYEVEKIANQAKSYLLDQFKRGIESTNEYIKEDDIQAEENIKKGAEEIKKVDPVLGEKFYKLYEKTADYDRAVEDIIKYVLDADKINGYFDKTRTSLKPFERKLAEIVKEFEFGAVELIEIGKEI